MMRRPFSRSVSSTRIGSSDRSFSMARRSSASAGSAPLLLPPFFDPKADPAVNYGGIGAVIGHEITHGFDDQGRKSDGTGMLRDWWAAEDAAKFEAQATKLGTQYESYNFPQLPGQHIIGRLTMGEN